MFSWAFRRRFLYLSIITLIVVPPIAFFVYFEYFKKDPTCQDGIRNQNEHGVDCGGVCVVACPYEVQATPTIQWVRPYYVSKGIYNLVAYLQNPNTSHISNPVKYVFNVYDEDNVLLQTQEGVVAFPTSKLFPIFSPTVNVGERVAKRASFEFLEPITWLEYFGENPELEVVERSVAKEDTTPVVEARIRNKTLHTYRDIEVVAIVYDNEGNGFAASRTFIDTISDREDVTVTFTWPEPFSSNVSRVEIIPKLELQVYKK